MSDIQTSVINEVIAPKKMNFFQRVAGVVISPGKVMENLAERPRIIFPLILTAFAQVALYVLRLPLYEDFLRKAAMASAEFAKSISGVELTPEMIEKNLSTSVIQSFIMTPIASLFSWVLITAIIFAIVKIGGGQGRFKQFLSVTGYAYVISALYLLITLGVSFISGSLHLQMPLTSIGSLFSDSMKGSFVFGMLKGIDIFQIWHYAVIAIGVTFVSGFRKRSVYMILAGLFLIGLLMSGASEAAMGAYL